MKEIEKAVLMSFDRNAEFINSVTEIVGERSPCRRSDILEILERPSDVRAVVLAEAADILENRLATIRPPIEFKTKAAIHTIQRICCFVKTGSSAVLSIQSRTYTPPEKFHSQTEEPEGVRSL